jgi:queuine tRNA-ribosyltransferase
MNPFELLRKDSNTAARLGVLSTAHGQVQTPVFMPVGTAGAIKGITPQQLESTQTSVILANTYHLMLRPGADVIAKVGGLHRFVSWSGPILTDSGGYQVFSLNSLTKIDDNGVEFASHVDGQKVYLDAKNAVSIQEMLGADVIMCLDQCAPYPCRQEELRTAVDRTIEWAKRCKAAHKRKDQLLFGIVQGGIDPELRSRCAAELAAMDFDGHALGGLSVGEGREDMLSIVEHTAPLLDEQKPRYLMGVGAPADIIAAVSAGVDMFDCVMPTRHGRNAYAFTDAGPLRLRNSVHIDDARPLEAGCDCYCCRTYTRSTLRHFFNVGEMLGPILLSVHNIRFYQRLMADIRGHIDSGDFSSWSRQKLEDYAVFCCGPTAGSGDDPESR